VAVLDEIVAALPENRVHVFKGLGNLERAALLEAMEREIRNPWVKYRDDPVAFVKTGLGEQVWSKQVEILESLRDNRRTAVPACHAPGKSHIAARAIAWWVAVHDPYKVRVVTTATTFRQVKGILWPHIRQIVAAHNLPGEVMTTEWKIGPTIVADGFSPADHNESAVQGIHAENLLIVVDEAGGISNTIGQALEALMTGGHTRLLLLGNPPTDEMGSWFERCCHSDLYNTIPIPAFSTPNFTGEKVGAWARNLVDRSWVDEVTRTFGEDSPFVQARVYARFPRTTSSAVIPVDWVERSRELESDPGVIRLGVDVAADGGDEFVIAEMDGMTARVRHASKNNRSAVDVCGTVLQEIKRAERLHAERGITKPVRVKIDSIGVGWGVVSLLEEWGQEGKHDSDIVGVNVAQAAYDREQFANQRAEMWWTMREALQPNEGGLQELALDIDHKVVQQLSAPSYRTTSSGKIQIESKADMAKRGVGSPDRAEAILLALFEPPTVEIPLVPPLSLTGNSEWF
jgi:hypothetical protein